MKCAYCSSEIKKGTGLMYVYKTGETAFYCSNSCYKNHVVMDRKINRKLLQGGTKATSAAKAPKQEAKVQPQQAPSTAAKNRNLFLPLSFRFRISSCSIPPQTHRQGLLPPFALSSLTVRCPYNRGNPPRLPQASPAMRPSACLDLSWRPT